MALTEGGPPTDPRTAARPGTRCGSTIDTGDGQHDTFPMAIVPERRADARRRLRPRATSWMSATPAAGWSIAGSRAGWRRSRPRAHGRGSAGGARGRGRAPGRGAPPDGGSSPLPWIAGGLVLLALAGAADPSPRAALAEARRRADGRPGPRSSARCGAPGRAVSWRSMTEGRSGAVRAMSDAVLAIAGERSVDTVLQRIVHTARELVGRALRGARRARRRGQLRALHHLGHDRGGGGGDGAAAAHARPAGRDARVRAVLPHARHQARPALPRLVAGRPSADGLVPRRADRGARRGGRRVLPDRQGAGASSSTPRTRS